MSSSRGIKETIGAIIDLRDVFVFGGLALLGYGLYLYCPWVSFAICGGIIMAIGLFIGRSK